MFWDFYMHPLVILAIKEYIVRGQVRQQGKQLISAFTFNCDENHIFLFFMPSLASQSWLFLWDDGLVVNALT